MTNVYGTPHKYSRKNQLFQIGVEALRQQGWNVAKVHGGGKASVRRITKAGESKLVSIRTTQDTYIAFPRNTEDTAWVTLSDVDYVLAVSVDNKDNPKFGNAHMIDGEDMRARFDRTYAARLKAGHQIPRGRGVWLSLYIDEATYPPALVGAGAGNVHKPIAHVPLNSITPEVENASEDEEEIHEPAGFEPLSIAEAKRRLALTLGVPEVSIKITIEG
jgi:hypothetical protein